MHSFQDTKGQSWDIAFTTSVRRRIRSRTGIEPLRLLSQPVLEKLSGDDGEDLIEKIIWATVEDQATARNMDADAFWSLTDSDVIEAAGDLLFEESVSAAPKKNKRLCGKC